MVELEPGEEIREIEGFPNYYVTSCYLEFQG